MLQRFARNVRALVLVIFAFDMSASAAFAETCVHGRPTITVVGGGDCHCYDGSPAGTKVYSNDRLMLTLDGRSVRLHFDGDLTCDATSIVVTSSFGPKRRVFPIRASLEERSDGSVSAMFAGLTPDRALEHRAKNGLAHLVRVFQ